jgi:hypothetical protein
MRRLIALAVLCTWPSLSQDLYTASCEFSGTNTNAAIAVQLASTTGEAEIVEATAQCLDAVCDIRPEVNGTVISAGTGATATSLSPQDPETTPAGGATGKATAWCGTSSTHIPIGTAVAPSSGWRIPAAGGILPLGGGRRMSSRGSGNKNYILRLAGSHTGAVRLYISVRVRR